MPADCPTGHPTLSSLDGAPEVRREEAQGSWRSVCAGSPPGDGHSPGIAQHPAWAEKGASHHTPEGGEPKTMKVREGQTCEREKGSLWNCRPSNSALAQSRPVCLVFNENID